MCALQAGAHLGSECVRERLGFLRADEVQAHARLHELVAAVAGQVGVVVARRASRAGVDLLTRTGPRSPTPSSRQRLFPLQPSLLTHVLQTSSRRGGWPVVCRVFVLVVRCAFRPNQRLCCIGLIFLHHLMHPTGFNS